MDKAALVNYIKNQLHACAGWGPDGVQAARTTALTYYLQRPRGDEVTGRSQVVSGDLSASVEANLAQMMEAYATSNIVEFDPTGEEDEDQAQLETDAVVYLAMRKGDGFIQLASATKDALLQRVGIMKAWCMDKVRAVLHSFDYVEDAQTLAYVLASLGEQSELVSYSNGSATIRIMQQAKQYQNAAVAPENFFYPTEAWDYNLQEIVFCAERHVEHRFKLYERFTKESVDAVKPFAGMRPDSDARNPGGVMGPMPAPAPTEPAYDLVEWLECYALLDMDGDGVHERHRIGFVWNDNEILEEKAGELTQPVTLVPYAMGTTILMPHRLTGLSQYDKLRMVQDENTGMKRARDDNVNAVTMSRTASLEGVVNPDDLGDGRVNGNLRVKSDVGITDVRQAITALAVQDNTGSVLQNIEAIKRDRTELGGAALELASGQLQIGGERMGSQGLDRAYSVMEQLASLMTKTLAHTLVRNLFLLAHATLREHYTMPVNVKLNGRWFSPIPSKWSERDAATVKLGMNPGERARVAGALRQIIQDQIFLTDKGMEGVLVDAERFYRAYMDWARISDVQHPEQYYIDPMSPPAQQELLRKAQAAQAESQKRDNLMSEAVKLRKVEVALPKYLGDQETEYKYWAKSIDAEIEEAKIAGAAVTQMLTHKNEKGEERGSANRPRTRNTATAA